MIQGVEHDLVKNDYHGIGKKFPLWNTCNYPVIIAKFLYEIMYLI